MIQASETVGFMRKSSPGQCFVTIHDMDNGFGKCWSMPRKSVASK